MPDQEAAQQSEARASQRQSLNDEIGSHDGHSESNDFHDQLNDKQPEVFIDNQQPDVPPAGIESTRDDDDRTYVPSIVGLTSPHKEQVTSPLLGGEEGENAEPSGFVRARSPFKVARSGPPTMIKGLEHQELHRMHKFSLYETLTRYYFIGSDVTDRYYRILKIDRTAPPGQISITEDEIVYSKREVNRLLNTIDDGNRAVGGMRYRGTFWGLLGFIRFTEAYYMLLIKQKNQVANIGGHYIFQVQDHEIIPLTTGSSSNFKGNRNAEENRFLSILGNLELNHHFYFSYSYNLTRTLQHNIIRYREIDARQGDPTVKPDLNDMFVWNQHLLDPAIEALKNPFDWCMPIIHGFIEQATIDIFGRNIYIAIIARRSRFFAGARFLKRGANDLGYVANDVETEQIAADMLVTSFNAPSLRKMKNPNYTSYVQHRGSIPLYWTQDSSSVSPKPAIDLNLIDPFYSTAALHFDNLFARYRAPIWVLNLVKAKERTPRESKLREEYKRGIDYLNQSLPDDEKIRYTPYDMSRAAKTKGQDVIGTLEKIADEIVKTTGFFQNDGHPDGDGSDYVQNGVVRSNCVDCLDRTNAAQFVIGKRALTWQLQALGVISSDANLNYDSDACNLFATLFNGHGDTLASQYGGSHLVNTTDSYRKINYWQSHSRDMLESFKRYYHNSFLDSQRQEAYNLFLGNYVYSQGQPMLWELSTDYHLHHTDPRNKPKRRDYIRWFTPENLEPVKLPPVYDGPTQRTQRLGSDWFDEYYRPSVMTSFHKLFFWMMKNTSNYLPKPSHTPSGYDVSPFCVRKNNDLERQASRDGLTPKQLADAEKALNTGSSAVPSPLSVANPPHVGAKRISSLQKWLYPDPQDDDPHRSSIKIDDPKAAATLNGNAMGKASGHNRRKSARSSTFDDDHEARIIAGMKEFKPSNKQLMNQWTLAQFHANSLNPSVSAKEQHEYEQYVRKPEMLMEGFVSFPDPDASAANGKDASEGNTRAKNKDRDPEQSTREFYEAYVRSGTQGEPASVIPSGKAMRDELRLEQEMVDYVRSPQHLNLSVTPADLERKRYQAYEKYMRGKSFFKQSTVDPENRVEIVT